MIKEKDNKQSLEESMCFLTLSHFYERSYSTFFPQQKKKMQQHVHNVVAHYRLIQGFHQGWSCSYSLPSHVPKFQTLKRKSDVQHKSKCVYKQSRHSKASLWFRESFKCQVPKLQLMAILQANLSKESSLRPPTSTLFWILHSISIF